MSTEAIVRKWGNSMGVILPKEIVEKEGLKENDKVIIEVIKEADMHDVFGSLKTDIKGQEFKDLVREGWR